MMRAVGRLGWFGARGWRPLRRFPPPRPEKGERSHGGRPLRDGRMAGSVVSWPLMDACQDGRHRSVTDGDPNKEKGNHA